MLTLHGQHVFHLLPGEVVLGVQALREGDVRAQDTVENDTQVTVYSDLTGGRNHQFIRISLSVSFSDQIETVLASDFIDTFSQQVCQIESVKCALKATLKHLHSLSIELQESAHITEVDCGICQLQTLDFLFNLRGQCQQIVDFLIGIELLFFASNSL